MNNKVVLKIVVICAAVFLVFGIFAAVFAARTPWDSLYREGNLSFGKSEPFEYHKNEEFDLTDIAQINIDVVSTDVEFYESAEKLEITLDCYGYTKKETITLVATQTGSTVTAKIKHPTVSWWSSFNITNSLLTVGIPKDYEGTVKIDGVSSDIRMNSRLDNSFAELEVDTTSGDADINCTQIDVLDFHTTSGKLNVKDTVVYELIAHTVSGDVNVNSIVSADGKVDIDTVSGKVSIAYEKLCETKIHTVSGDVNLDIPANTQIDLDFDSVSGDIRGDYNKNSDGVYVYVDTTSGDLKIN